MLDVEREVVIADVVIELERPGRIRAVCKLSRNQHTQDIMVSQDTYEIMGVPSGGFRVRPAGFAEGGCRVARIGDVEADSVRGRVFGSACRLERVEVGDLEVWGGIGSCGSKGSQAHDDERLDGDHCVHLLMLLRGAMGWLQLLCSCGVWILKSLNRERTGYIASRRVIRCFLR